VGTGPFILDEWLQGDHMKLSRNKQYWRSGAPLLDGVTLSIAKDAQALATQLEAGVIDVMTALPPGVRVDDFVRLKDDARYVGLLQAESGAVQTIGMSATKAPFDNKSVRQAFNWAVDRRRYNDTVLKGTGVAGSLPWGIASPAYDQDKDAVYQFDLDRAQALVQQAGVGPLEIDLYTMSGDNQTDAFNQIYQADLAKIGVKVNIKSMDLAAWVDTVNNVKYFGIWVGGIAYTQFEPSTALLSSRGLTPNGNSSGFTSEAYMRLVNESAAEPDTNRRRALYLQIDDLLLDESFLIVLSRTPSRLVTAAKVRDLQPTLHGTFSPTDAWLAA
jgi:peptide/nickel transport system substrate-binding protein